MFDSHHPDHLGRLVIWGWHQAYILDRAEFDPLGAHQGALDQWQDRLHGMQEAVGSSPTSSTSSRQSSKVGPLTFNQSNAGSNPVCRTKLPRPTEFGVWSTKPERAVRLGGGAPHRPICWDRLGVLSQGWRVRFLHGSPDTPEV